MNRQKQMPLLLNLPRYHVAPRPIIARPYQQQNPQVTHHLVYTPVIIVALPDQIINLLAHQEKLTHPTLYT